MGIIKPNYTLFFKLAIFISCPFIFAACCTTDYDSETGIIFKEVDQAKITRIDLIGVNKTINYNASEARITLNPADTISRYRVHFENDSGEVEIVYKKGELTNADASCQGDLVLRYEPSVFRTSFSNVQFINKGQNNKYVEITR